MALQLGSTDDAEKRRQLRSMKVLATSLLVGATVIYLFCRWREAVGAPGWLGYVRAASEAAMVGALADWFAVTALFKRPMGLPIPHTALIKRKKDQLGQALSGFVRDNFLSPAVLVDKVSSMALPSRVAEWLADPEHARLVAAQSAVLVRGVVESLDDADVEAIVNQGLLKRLARPQWGPPLGRILAELVAADRQRPIVDLLAERAQAWAQGSGETIERIVHADAPSWAPRFVNLLLAEKIQAELIEFTRKIRVEPDHQVRRAIDDFLHGFAEDLQHDPETIAKAERVKDQVLGRKEIGDLATAGWAAVKKLVIEAVDEPDSPLRERLAGALMRLAGRLREDDALLARVNAALERGTAYIAEHCGDEITTVISDTVERWDADEASEKIELQVGRDLQFIRINGTVVGALAGLTIYAVSDVVFGVLT